MRAHRRGVRLEQGLGDCTPPAGSSPGSSQRRGRRASGIGWRPRSCPGGRSHATPQFLAPGARAGAPRPPLLGPLLPAPFLRTRVPRWPRVAPLGRGIDSTVYFTRVPRAHASGGAAALSGPGCPACERWWWEGWLLSRPLREPWSPSRTPRCWESGWPRLAGGLPRPLRHPSGRPSDSSAVTAQGGARGPDLQGRKWPAAFPLCRPGADLCREVLGRTWYP